MTSAWQIRKFLLRQPRAAMVKLQSSQGTQEIRPSRTGSLSKMSDSIFAMSPDVIELYDADGKLLRAMRTDADGEVSADTPKPPTALSTDPETARLQYFSQLLAHAYEFSVSVAFNKLVDLVERIDSRSDALEQRLERTEAAYRGTLLQQLRDAQEEAEEVLATAAEQETEKPSSEKEAFLSALLQGRMEGAAQPASPTNGKGKA